MLRAKRRKGIKLHSGEKAMRKRIALQKAVRAKFSITAVFAKLWERARVIASLLSRCSVRCPQRILSRRQAVLR